MHRPIDRIIRARRCRQRAAAATPPPAPGHNIDAATGLLAQRGAVVVARATWDELCATAAAGITAAADLDRDHRALFGPWR